jgi:hypothetical protein
MFRARRDCEWAIVLAGGSGTRLSGLACDPHGAPVLPSADFSRDVLAGSEVHLRRRMAGPCGWTDLGTPERVGQLLATLPAETHAPRMARACADLATLLAAQKAHAARPAAPASVTPLAVPAVG